MAISSCISKPFIAITCIHPFQADHMLMRVAFLKRSVSFCERFMLNLRQTVFVVRHGSLVCVGPVAGVGSFPKGESRSIGEAHHGEGRVCVTSAECASFQIPWPGRSTLRSDRAKRTCSAAYCANQFSFTPNQPISLKLLMKMDTI